MKKRYLSIAFTCIIITLTACLKENKNPVIGKWQLNKVRIYEVDNNNTIINDTTYSGNTFTNLDYVQFNSNGTCIFSGSRNYYPAHQVNPSVAQITTSKNTLNYTTNGSRYVLTSLTPLPFEVYESDTATLVDPNNLHDHYIGHGPTAGPVIVSDSYYIR